MAARDGRSKFWRDLSGHLARLDKSESWLARRLNLPVQTVATWKQRNQFRRACLAQLGEVLHWDSLDEERAVRLGVELIEGKVPRKTESHATEEMLRRINREYRIAEKGFTRYAGHTVRLLQTLGEGCFYAFSAPTNTPYEFENTPDGHAIAVAIAQAICQGAPVSTSALTSKVFRFTAIPGALVNSFIKITQWKNSPRFVPSSRAGWCVVRWQGIPK